MFLEISKHYLISYMGICFDMTFSSLQGETILQMQQGPTGLHFT